jgi:type VII secretion protein EccB
MQSALIRKDAVMLHDPMRTHTRSMIIGVALSAVALAGFAIYGLLKPAPTLPDKDTAIIVSKQSGQLYVMSKQPNGKKLLTPTFNLASARLLLMAQQQQSSGGQQAGQQQQAGQPQQVVTADEVDDSQLTGVAVGRMTGIPDGPSLLPADAKQQASGTWSVCDDTQRDADLNNPTQKGVVKTTALVGVDKLGNGLKANEGLLVKAPNDKTYLIYKTPTSANKPEADAVRAEIDLSKHELASVFTNGNPGAARPISMGLLNSIPAVPELTVSDPPGANSAPPNGLPGSLKVGQVFQVNPPGEQPQYYLVEKSGIQQVTQSYASVAQAHNSGQRSTVPSISQESIVNVPRTNDVSTAQFPDQVPELLQNQRFPTVCLGWNANTSDPVNKKEHTVVTVGQSVPIPDGIKPVDVGSPNVDGQKIDYFYMPSGKAAYVHSAQGPGQFDSGPLYLVSDRGIRYGIPDNKTGSGLGLQNAGAAPDSIARLLPSGAQLDTKTVLRTFDSLKIPDNAGSYPAQGAKPASAGGGG